MTEIFLEQTICVLFSLHAHARNEATHYCVSQELVNLLLTGHAVSNVFDGNVNLDSGTTQQVNTLSTINIHVLAHTTHSLSLSSTYVAYIHTRLLEKIAQ